MKSYVGIDLHSNNSYIVIIDETDKILYKKRLENDIQRYENVKLTGQKIKNCHQKEE